MEWTNGSLLKKESNREGHKSKTKTLFEYWQCENGETTPL
jgi:hypothetical protein